MSRSPSSRSSGPAGSPHGAASLTSTHRPRRGRRTLSTLILGGGLTVALAALGASRHESAPAIPAQTPGKAPPTNATTQPAQQTVIAKPMPRPRVEMVFALDTTGSMTGLIEGAKRKIWSLASFVARGQPTPDLRVGLVAYRDIGDAYVTRRWDLDGDLDRVYERLQQLSADGGGDGPEHVARALHESVNKMSWTAEQSVVKVIYLVGDAPPHTDYADGFTLPRAARQAAKKGIAVHAIRCGTDPETATAWQRVAQLGKGEMITIRQNGGMREHHTPYDDKLAALHDKVSATAIGYGAHGGAAKRAMASAAMAPASVKAERAAFMAKKKAAVGGRGDLVAEIASGKVDLDTVEKKDLPEPMREMELGDLKQAVEEQAKVRSALQTEIDALATKRDAYLRAEAKKEATEGKGGDGFDDVARRTLRKTVADNPMAGLKL